MKEYHFNKYGCCVDYDKPIVRNGADYEYHIYVARIPQGWVSGHKLLRGCQCSINLIMRDREEQAFATKREAILKALIAARVFFSDASLGKPDKKVIERINAQILDYSTPSLFPEEES